MGTNSKSGSSYLRWIIADDYYDGAVSGIGQRESDDEFVWFRVVAWDSEQWQRIFAVTTINSTIAGELINSLERVEARRIPFWLPSPASDTTEINVLWDQVLHAAMRENIWWLVEAHDLIGSTVRKCVSISKSDVSAVVEKIRSSAIIDVSSPSLIDEFLTYIHSI